MATQAAPAGRYAWYVLGILTLAQTCHSIDRAIIGLVLEPLGREFGFSDKERGFLAGFAYGIFFAIAAIPFGIAVDRYNRRKLMTVALAGWSSATAACGFAGGFWSLFAGRAAVGLTEAGGSPTGMSLLSDYFGPRRRATAIGIWYTSAGIGMAFAFVVGGWLVQNHGWRAAFIAAGVPGLMLAPLLFFTVREPRRGGSETLPHVTDETLTFAARLRGIVARPGLVHAMVSITFIATGVNGMAVWVTTFLMRSHGVGIAHAGMIVAGAFGIMGSIGGLGAGMGADWLNRRRGGYDAARTATFGAMIPFATAITGIGCMMAGSLPLAIALLFACGLFSASYNGPVISVIVTLAGPHLRGLAIALVQFGANLIGVGLGAYLIGAISEGVGGDRGVAVGIAVAMLFVAAGGAQLLLAARSIRRGEAAALTASA
jgi:MFS family permease